MRSIRTQLILVFLLVILVPSALITYLMYTQSLSLLEGNLADAQLSKLSKTASLIDQSLSDMSLLLDQLAGNPEFAALASGINADTDEEEALPLAAIMRTAQSFYNRHIGSTYLYLYGPQLIVTSFANQRIVNVRNPQYYDWISQYPLKGGDRHVTQWFLSRGVPSPSLSEQTGRAIFKKRLISDANGRPLGELGMLISGNTLRSAYLDAMRGYEGEMLMLLDEDLNPISAVGMDVPRYRSLAQEAFFEQIPMQGARQGLFHGEAFGNPMQICYTQSPRNGFVYVSLVPVSQYANDMTNVGMQGVLVALVAAVAAVFVSIWYSMRISRPINMLKAAMLRAGSGDLSVRADYARQDDFAQITDGFNNMIGRISQLMRDLSNEELLLKEAELRNLQAQINPHFLYNTLETMHWMASLNQTRQVKDLCASLANFYRATLSGGRKTVSVKESLAMIHEYVAILSARYGERFSVYYDASEGFEDEQVLHLVLQPLVENVMQHSIERVSYHVNLHIGFERDGDDLIVTVHDDGTGIDEEMLRRIRASLDDEQTRPEGFALKNVHKRVRLMYGEGYGLSIDSAQGEYTTVRVRMRRLQATAYLGGRTDV